MLRVTIPDAVELLNLITGKEALIAAFSLSQDDPYPQYLLAARYSIYDELSDKYPIYGELKGIVSDPDCQVFTLRPSGREILAEVKELLSKE